jgi:hypothetical protein
MDVDQLLKRVQWIEDERRKEKDSLALIENRVTGMEGSMLALSQQIKELTGEIARLTAVVTRMDQYDANLLQQRIESKKQLEELEKDVKKKDDEKEKVRRIELKSVENSIAELRKELEPITRLEKAILVRAEEEARLRRLIDETRERIETLKRDEEEYIRTFRVLEDGRKQDSKRILDLLGEVTALRKRVDDQRGQIEVLGNTTRKQDTRLNELLLVEAERRDAVANFLDKQNLAVVERDRIWKEWQTRFETIEKQAADVDARLLTLDVAQREAKRAQITLEELAQRVERRINEITEIQRLSEDRFRQEWVTFKADDQKRWTNYTLTQEEQRGEAFRQFEKLTDRSTQLEDSLQEAQDILQQMNEQSEKRIQSLLAVVHEWVSAYERSVGRSR